MSFFGRIIKDAIGDGISKAVSGAVENAVQKAVKPAAENLANSAAQSINNSAAALNEVNKEMDEAAKEVAKETAENPEAAEAFSELKKATMNWAKEMETVVDKYEKDEAFREKKEAELIADTALKNFPKWTYGEIVSSATDETDEYVAIHLYVKGSEETVEKYRADLAAEGFTGDWQIQKKVIGGKEHAVDFTFFFDDENNDIHYVINK